VALPVKLKEIIGVKSIKEITQEIEKSMRCNCDLDNWQPDKQTGHSWVCRIHKTAIQKWRSLKNLGCGGEY